MVHLLAEALFLLPHWLQGKAQHPLSPDPPFQAGSITPPGAALALSAKNAFGPGAHSAAAGRLPIQPGASAADAQHPSAAERKLRQAAQEFEAQLISAFWQSMHEMSLTGEDGANDDPGHDTLNQMSIQAIASGLAAHGGFGIGALLAKQLQPSLRDAGGKDMGN